MEYSSLGKICLIHGCSDNRKGDFYCARHTVLPATYGVTQKRRIPLYGTWINMLNRCYNPSHALYRHYGGRGITVCDEWRNSFDSFYQDLHPKPEVKMSIDRIDVDGNYEPRNVRWADAITQRHNQRRMKLAV